MNLLWLSLLACSGEGSESGSTDGASCDCEAPGDIEDVPDILGFWTVSFADRLFDENCGLSDLSQSSETWIKEGAMEIKGRVPDTIYAEIDGTELWGAMSNGGGLVLEGYRESVNGTMHVSIGGLVYQESYVYNRPVIDGWAFLGLSTIEDGLIDCAARGDFLAIQSGR